MDNLFGRNRVFTVPNAFSLLRLLMVPAIVALYRAGHTVASAAAVVLSGITDVADGMIARRWNQVTDLGKILDPVADKITLASLIVCLIPRYPGMILLLTVFAIREFVMMGLGYAVLKTARQVGSARWYGKVATAMLYGVLVLLIVLPQIPRAMAEGMILVCGVTIVLAWLGYLNGYRTILGRQGKI